MSKFDKVCRRCGGEKDEENAQLCNGCKKRAVKKRGKKQMSQNAGHSSRGPSISKERVEKARELRKGGYEAPWESSNGFE